MNSPSIQHGPPIIQTRAARWAGRIENAAARSPVLASLVVSIMTFSTFLVVARPRFDTNDDVRMMFIVSGRMLGEPSRHITFSNVLVGDVLSWLYRTYASIEWYPLYLLVIHFVAFAAVVYVAMADRRFRLHQYGTIFMALILASWWHAWMNLQFTSTAMMVAFAGLLLHLLAPPAAYRWASSFIGGLMLGVASLVRFEAFAVAMIVAIPAALFLFHRVRLKHHVLFAVIATGIVAGGLVYQGVVYSDEPGWQDYFEFNAARGRLHDTPRLDDVDDSVSLVAPVGWSANDIEMFNNWFFFDEETYSQANLEQVGDIVGGAPVNLPRQVAFEVRNQLAAVIAAMALLGLAGLYANRREGLMLASSALLAGVISLYLLISRKLPMRVTLPQLGFLGFLAFIVPGLLESDETLMVGSESGSARRRRFAFAAVAGILSVGVLNLAWELAVASPANSEDSGALIMNLEQLQSLNSEGRFIMWSGDLSLESYSPTRTPSIPDVNLISTSWEVRSPDHDTQLADLGIGNVYRAIVEDPNVYLVVASDREEAPLWFASYVSEHFDFDGTLAEVAELDGGRLLVLAGAN